MTPDALAIAGDVFAQDLLDVLELICPAPSVQVDRLGSGSQENLRPLHLGPAQGRRPAEAGLVRTTTAGIDLRFFYRYDLDPSGGYLRVLASSIGLSLTPSGRCLLRVEYDRGKGPDRPDAHMHVDADGALWGKALTLSDQPLRLLNTLHIPAGGRRFRPTMEDVIEFLLAEKFVSATRAGWREVLRAKRHAWEERQAQAAARQHAPAVAATLRDLGWTVTEPDQEADQTERTATDEGHPAGEVTFQRHRRRSATWSSVFPVKR